MKFSQNHNFKLCIIFILCKQHVPFLDGKIIREIFKYVEVLRKRMDHQIQMGGEPISQLWFHKTLSVESVFILHWSMILTIAISNNLIYFGMWWNNIWLVVSPFHNHVKRFMSCAKVAATWKLFFINNTQKTLCKSKTIASES